MSRRNRLGRSRAQPRDLEVDAVSEDDEDRAGPMAVEVIAVADLHIDPANVRRHPERNMAAIKASLARFDQVKPIVIDANNVVRAGNGTLEAARELGWATIKCVRSDLCGADMVAYSVADNRSAELAEWNEDALGATLRALQDEDFDLDAVGFTDAEVDALFGAADAGTGDGGVGETPEPRVDEAAELQKKWGTQLGDLWIIPSERVAGKEHRLLCGDSTLASTVDRLMGGATATMVFADPPYGYKYESNYYEGGNPFGMLLNDDRILDFATAADGILADDCAVYTCSGHQTAHFWRNLLDRILTYKNTIVWKKNNWGMGDLHGAYAGQYEIIFFHHRGRPLLRGERSRDVWEFDRDPPENHPTQKPVELVAFAMAKSSDPGDTTYDPFCGSGTSMVAAEQSGRLCAGIELSPTYSAVILERLADMGLQPRHA